MKFPLFLDDEVSTVRKHVSALERLEVSRVDGVARPAHARAFLVAKSAFSPQIEEKLGVLKRLGCEPTPHLLHLAKTGGLDLEATLDGQIAARTRKSRVEKSAPELGTGVFSDLITSPWVEKGVGATDRAVGAAPQSWRPESEDEDDSKAKRAKDEDDSKAKATDGDDDDDDFVGDERRQRGVAAKAAHRYMLYTEGADGKPAFHSSHATRTGAMGKAHSMLESGEAKRVAVEDAMEDETKSRSLKTMKERYRKYGSDGFLSGSISAERAFALEGQEGRDFWRPGRQPRGVDTTQDSLMRAYSDEVYATISGNFPKKLVDGEDLIPEAGGLTNTVGDTRSLDYAPQRFAADEGNYVGGEDRGGSLGRPIPPYGLLKEGEEPDTLAPIRVGDNWLMPSAYDAHGPASARFPTSDDISLLKIRKNSRVGRGVFSNVVFAPIPGSNRF